MENPIAGMMKFFLEFAIENIGLKADELKFYMEISRFYGIMRSTMS